jgi:hypothetical protein
VRILHLIQPLSQATRASADRGASDAGAAACAAFVAAHAGVEHRVCVLGDHGAESVAESLGLITPDRVPMPTSGPDWLRASMLSRRLLPYLASRARIDRIVAWADTRSPLGLLRFGPGLPEVERGAWQRPPATRPGSEVASTGRLRLRLAADPITRADSATFAAATSVLLRARVDVEGVLSSRAFGFDRAMRFVAGLGTPRVLRRDDRSPLAAEAGDVVVWVDVAARAGRRGSVSSWTDPGIAMLRDRGLVVITTPGCGGDPAFAARSSLAADVASAVYRVVCSRGPVQTEAVHAIG